MSAATTTPRRSTDTSTPWTRSVDPTSSPSSTSFYVPVPPERDPYFPYKHIRSDEMCDIQNICAMDAYREVSQEELRESWYRNNNDLRETLATRRILGVHSDGTPMRYWEMEVSVGEWPDRSPSPALSVVSLGSTTRAPSPTYSSSSGSTIKASRYMKSAFSTPAASEYSTPVQNCKVLPRVEEEPSFSSQRTVVANRQDKNPALSETPTKRSSAVSRASSEDTLTGTPTSEAYQFFSSPSPSPSPSPTPKQGPSTPQRALPRSERTPIPPSPAATRHAEIMTAELAWEASVRLASARKLALAKAQAEYDRAVREEREALKRYYEVRMEYDA